MRMAAYTRLGMVLAWLATSLACAAPLPLDAVPEALKSWVPWVMHGNEIMKCPQAYNSADSRRCVWPSQLVLQVGARAAAFRLDVQVFGADASVELPGEVEYWPQEVKADGQPAPVVLKNNHPVLVLPAGAHVVTGSVFWSEMPQNLLLPKAAGIVHLSIANKNLNPLVDAEGRLWLRKEAQPQQSQDSLSFRTYRLVADDIPLRVSTRYEIAVAGTPREILLRAALLEGFVAESIASVLPARLEANGDLKLQVRAGNWPVEISGRLMAPTTSLTLPAAVATTTGEEI